MIKRDLIRFAAAACVVLSVTSLLDAATLRLDELFLFGSMRLFATEREERNVRTGMTPPTVESAILVATKAPAPACFGAGRGMLTGQAAPRHGARFRTTLASRQQRTRISP